MHFQIAGKHFFRAPTGCEPVFLTLNRCHNLFPSLLTVVNYIFWSLNSRDPLFSQSKQLQQCLSGSKQLGTSFMHFQIAGKHFFRTPTGCEPVFLTLNRCHNLFPSFLTVVKYIFWSPNSRDPLFSISKLLQHCLSGSKQLGTSFSHFQIAGKHFFRAPSGCEPVFLTLNRCHNLFPCS